MFKAKGWLAGPFGGSGDSRAHWRVRHIMPCDVPYDGMRRNVMVRAVV